MHEGARGDDDQRDHLEGKEDARPAGRDVDAARHQDRGQADEGDHEPRPRRRRDGGRVVVQEDRDETTRHHQHGDDGDHVARDEDDRGGDRAGRAERLADERDERAGRGVRARELGERVAEKGDRHARGDDGERRGDAGGEGEKAEPEVEAHRRSDVGHGRRGDVDGTQDAAHQPLRLAWRLVGRGPSAGRGSPGIARLRAGAARSPHSRHRSPR